MCDLTVGAEFDDGVVSLVIDGEAQFAVGDLHELSVSDRRGARQ